MKIKQSAPSRTIAVKKKDLVQAWRLLERAVVSMRKIGSAYAIPINQDEQTPEQKREMLETIGEYFDAEFFRELVHARRVLVEYLPSGETERISEQMDEQGLYWQAKRSQ